MNCYISFLELEQYALAESAAWAIPMIIRHDKLVHIVGGWARVLRCFLDRLLFGTHGLVTAGMALQLHDQPVAIFGKLHCLLADGEGLKYSFDWKGSSGLKPCLTHFNVCKKQSDLAGRCEGFVEVSCADPSKFRAWTQADAVRSMAMINEASRRVHARTLPKRRLEEVSMIYGLNANEHSLFNHPRLSSGCTTDLLSTVTYDWVHSFLQDGAFAVEAWVFLQRCEAHGTTSAAICAFLRNKAWVWPSALHHKSACMWRIFDSYRSQSSETANKLKASASEVLSLSGMLRFFVDTHVPRIEELAAPRASFETACQVLDIILMCKRGVIAPQVGAARLQRALGAHMTWHNRAYGDQHIRPKHHWMFHVGPQLSRDGAIIDAFVVERGHLLVKSIAEHCKDTTCYEATVMAGVVNQQFKNASVAKLGSGLRGTISDWHHVEVAAQMTVLGLHVFGC